jgi:hypothetical protein
MEITIGGLGSSATSTIQFENEEDVVSLVYQYLHTNTIICILFLIVCMWVKLNKSIASSGYQIKIGS